MEIEDLIGSGIANIVLIDEMFNKYQENPGSVEASWRNVFDQLDEYSPKQIDQFIQEKETIPLPPAVERADTADLRIYHLIQAYRTFGHLQARFNCIATGEKKEPWQLQLKNLGFSQQELPREFPTNELLGKPRASLQEIIATLKEIYCRNIGVEYMGLLDPDLEKWLQQRIEPNRFQIKLNIDQKKMILQHLNKSELFECFLHTKYVGQKRFSLEGGETLIPILATIIDRGASLGMQEFILGMAHRGRLNVLSNILKKSYEQIFSEFEERYIPLSVEGSGDVKYHKGFSSVYKSSTGEEVDIILTPNPSHLEAVNGVVLGITRAKQVQKKEECCKEKVVPILIHGDAAISGQGIVYETMQLYDLKGYATGGTIHIVINNQIGFTTLPKDGRSTMYCTDIARAFNAPVFHVDAEDPESCIYATNLAVELRQHFHCDVFIDINCYRKFGHNEADEPAFTQPLEYQIIRKKKSIREIYRDDLIQQGVLEKQMAEALEKEFKGALQKALTGTRYSEEAPIEEKQQEEKVQEDSSIFAPSETSVSREILLELTQKFCQVPEKMSIHRKLVKVLKDRRKMAKGEKPIDWGMGETLAYATLLEEGTPVRLSGQDCCRGTFSHRHALWMDQVNGKGYYPLKHLSSNQGRFDVINSPLSEYGVMAFEFGYSLAYPEALVIWEAQFGDFSNCAQVVIDQFISTGEMKWGQKNGVVLFLPHGYEGQGPEHSSARMERFLSLCGNNNMQVVNPTSPAQLFHLLRRHIRKPMRKPLIVFTPKGLLRHPKCVSTLENFSRGTFQEILDDPTPPKKVKKLTFCCGRIYYDLIAEREKRGVDDMAIVRIEQLYPLNQKKLQELIEKYSGIEKCNWVQEEPKNRGAWDYIRPVLRQLLPGIISPKYAGRERSASPAAGSFALHKKMHQRMLNILFG